MKLLRPMFGRVARAAAGLLVLLTGMAAAGPESGPVVTVKKQQSAKELLLILGGELDSLKKKVDEWGTVAFAPIIFAPPSFTELPFGMTGSEALKFDDLYADYGQAQGQSLFGQRTLTSTQGAADINTDAVKQELEQTQVQFFQENTRRAIAADTKNRAVSLETRDEARRRLAKAQAADAEQEKAADSATVGLASATAELKAADDALAFEKARLPKPDDAKVAKATLQQIEEQKRKTIAEAQLAAVNAQKERTATELKAAQTAADTAETGFNTVLGQQIAAPTDGPAGTPPAPPLSGLSTDGKPLSGLPLTTASGALGAKALPVPIGKAQLADTAPAPTAQFSPLARINSAAAAQTVKNIHAFLGNPAAAKAFEDKRILFGVSSLSVDPGWRSKRDFKAVIEAKVVAVFKNAHAETIREILRCPDYSMAFRKRIADSHWAVLTEEQKRVFQNVTPADEEECRRWAARTPRKPRANADSDLAEDEVAGLVVSAVTPMVDSQNLDLSSSIARQDEIALYLAASLARAGNTAAAKFFTSWSQSRRKDVATHSSLATANSHTMGNYFGFEIGTRLRGLDDDAVRGNRAAQTLDRQTFPILLIFGLEPEDARPRFAFDGKKIAVTEPTLRMDYSTTWSRTTHNFFTDFKPQRRLSAGYREVLDLGAVRQNVAAQPALRADLRVPPEAPVALQRQYELQAIRRTVANMEREYQSLVGNLYGKGVDLSLPAKWLLNPSRVDDQSPDAKLRDPAATVQGDKITFDPANLLFDDVNVEATVILCGSHLDLIEAAKVEVLGPGVVTSSVQAQVLAQDKLAVKLQTTAPEGNLIFVLPLVNGKGSAAANPLPFRVRRREPPSFANWASTSYRMEGTLEQGFWTGQLQLVLRGTHLDQLASQASLRGLGLNRLTGDPAPTITPSGPQAALVIVPLRSKTGEGEAFLEFTDAQNPNRKFLSSTFQFVFDKAVLPSLQPWGQTEFLAAATEKEGKFSATLTLPLKGEGLPRLGPPELRGDAPGTALLRPADPQTAIVQVQITKVKELTGQAYLEFPVLDGPAGAKVFSQPFQYRLIKPQAPSSPTPLH